MQSSNSRSVIPAVLLDWAGTVVDHGSVAPVKALEEVFGAAGVSVPMALVRRYMGLAKKDHVRKLLQEHEVAQRWMELYGSVPGEAEVDALYGQSEPPLMAPPRVFAPLPSGVVSIAPRLPARRRKPPR